MLYILCAQHHGSAAGSGGQGATTLQSSVGNEILTKGIATNPYFYKKSVKRSLKSV